MLTTYSISQTNQEQTSSKTGNNKNDTLYVAKIFFTTDSGLINNEDGTF